MEIFTPRPMNLKVLTLALLMEPQIELARVLKLTVFYLVGLIAEKLADF
jgi:hypothetical protein